MDDAQPDIVPGCPLGNEAQLTIKLILLVCTAGERKRKQCIGTANAAEKPTIRDILESGRSIDVFTKNKFIWLNLMQENVIFCARADKSRRFDKCLR